MHPQLQQIIRQIATKFHPEKIILFGSHADGKAGQDSDVDLLVVMHFEGSARNQAVRILQAIDYHLPLDLIVRSSRQLSERIQAGDFFLKDILEKGKVVYDRAAS